MQENISKYIGIPWIFNGDTFSGADCSGLAILFYRNHGWKPDTYDKPKERDWYTRDKFKMERFMLKNFDKTRDISMLTFGDIVVMRINGETHMGIYLEYNKILSTFPPNVKLWDGSYMPDRSCIVRKEIWIPSFVAGFKRRKEE